MEASLHSDVELHLLVKKNFDFSKFMACLKGQGGLIFVILCRRLLWTVPICNINANAVCRD